MQELCHMGWLCFAMPAHAAQIPNNRGAATTARVKCTTAQRVPFRAKPGYRQFGHTSKTRCATHGSRMPDHRLPDAPGKVRNDLQPSLPIQPVMPQIVTIPLPLINTYAPYRALSSHRAPHRNGSPKPYSAGLAHCGHRHFPSGMAPPFFDPIAFALWPEAFRSRNGQLRST